MSEILIAIISGLLTGGVFGFIQFLITRKDNKTKESDQIIKKLDEIQVQIEELKKNDKKLEKDSVRLQLTQMYELHPEKTDKILEIAHHYFVDLKGNWYATDLFKEFLKKNNIEQPSWFIEK